MQCQKTVGEDSLIALFDDEVLILCGECHQLINRSRDTPHEIFQLDEELDLAVVFEEVNRQMNYWRNKYRRVVHRYTSLKKSIKTLLKVLGEVMGDG